MITATPQKHLLSTSLHSEKLVSSGRTVCVNCCTAVTAKNPGHGGRETREVGEEGKIFRNVEQLEQC